MFNAIINYQFKTSELKNVEKLVKQTINAFRADVSKYRPEPMLKTRKNTIRNQCEQEWSDVNSFQKPRRLYPAIWYNLKSFAHRKGRFTLSTPAKCTSHVSLSEGQAL